MSANREIESGARFGFGANWARFLSAVDEERIAAAESSLKEMLRVETLEGLRVLDVGSGSGLFSLAARRLGATVHSFDCDPQSVACTQELKRRHFPEDESWHIEQGSALDSSYLESLGAFDVVYSWGVLHHTGAMWLGIENAIRRVAPSGGRLFIAIYNDQGWKSHLWWFVKFFYNQLPGFLRAPFVFAIGTMTRLLVIIKYSIKREPTVAIAPLLTERRPRGMSGKHDLVDWIGGFPYEFAEFETLRAYCEARGFSVVSAKPCRSLGCNELALERTGSSG
jgi:SAM-dependent methyltransferase